MLRKMAVDERYQPYSGGCAKMKVPWKVPRISCHTRPEGISD